MEWKKYHEKFTKKALLNGLDTLQIKEHLEYASRLHNNNLPIIYDQVHLSLLLGYNYDYLLRASNSPSRFYRTFTIPKKSGKKRPISEPLPSLKEIQTWILHEILYKGKVSDYAKAYVPERSLKDNARFHRKQDMLLTIDITDFFGSIKFNRVFGYYKEIGYNEGVATMLANLCCLYGKLPQGAPSSAALSNLISRKMDKRIAGFARKHRIRYTRYADDLTFSGSFDPGRLIRFVSRVFKEEKFTINSKKTRLRKAHQRQEVTGIVVNQKLQASRTLRRNINQEIYFINKYGLHSHLERTNNLKGNYLKRLLGKANFTSFVNPKDMKIRNHIVTLQKLLKPTSREIPVKKEKSSKEETLVLQD